LAAGIPLVAAGSDEEAGRLGTSPFKRYLNVIRGDLIFVPAPVDSMHGLWSEPDGSLLNPDWVRLLSAIRMPFQQKLARFLSLTNVDELIFASDLYDHRDRLRSCEIAAEAMKTLDEAELQRI
jgi:hypothetical protein